MRRRSACPDPSRSKWGGYGERHPSATGHSVGDLRSCCMWMLSPQFSRDGWSRSSAGLGSPTNLVTRNEGEGSDDGEGKRNAITRMTDSRLVRLAATGHRSVDSGPHTSTGERNADRGSHGDGP